MFPGYAPFSKPTHAFLEIPSCFELGICHRLDRDLGQRMADQGAQMLREAAEGVIAALDESGLVRKVRV